MNPELETLIEELSSSPKYSHGVFGCFLERKSAGHVFQEVKGPIKNIIKYTDMEDEDAAFEKNWCWNLDDREKSEGEFKARIWAEKIEEGFKFKLIFDDRQGDERYGSHTDYTLLVPESEVERIKPVIESNPEIMIKVFQKVFPSYDRSNGKLEMRSDHVYFEYNNPSQIDRLHRILRWK